MQYWNDLWNSAVCKSRRRLLSSNVAGRRYWFRAAAIIVRLRTSRGYLRRDARGSFPRVFARVLFSFRGISMIFLLYIFILYSNFSLSLSLSLKDRTNSLCNYLLDPLLKTDKHQFGQIESRPSANTRKVRSVSALRATVMRVAHF